MKMTKTQMVTEMLDAGYEPAYKDGALYWFKKYGVCEKTKEHAFNQLKYHTAGTNRVEKLYYNFKKGA